MESLPLPNVLVTLDTICIVDVTGIEGANLLWWTLLATLWEHDYCGGHSDIIISDSNRYKVVLSPKQLFSLCQNCGGSLKLFAYPSMSSVVRPGCLITEPSHWYRAPDVVVTVFSHFPKKFVCTVHLAGAESVGIILDRIVKELQCHHYYVSNRGTGPISEHRGEGIVRGSAAAFYGHFREDIGPDGSLKLYVDAYQARAAKRIIKQQPGINDLNVPGKGLPRIAVTIVARRRLVCTVVLTGIDDPPMIRQRIIEALRFYGYLIRPDLVITQTDCSAEMTYSPLTDDELFSLCREQGDKHGSLNLFVEASTLVYAPEYERPQRGPLPNIVIRVLDWDNQQPYFDMNMTGLETYEVYRVLCNEVEGHTNMKLVRIYGPQLETWFSLEEYHLFDLIQEKGSSIGSLKLFVYLQGQEELRSPRFPLYVPSPRTRKLSYLNSLRFWLTPWLRKGFWTALVMTMVKGRSNRALTS